MPVMFIRLQRTLALAAALQTVIYSSPGSPTIHQANHKFPDFVRRSSRSFVEALAPKSLSAPLAASEKPVTFAGQLHEMNPRDSPAERQNVEWWLADLLDRISPETPMSLATDQMMQESMPSGRAAELTHLLFDVHPHLHQLFDAGPQLFPVLHETRKTLLQLEELSDSLLVQGLISRLRAETRMQSFNKAHISRAMLVSEETRKTVNDFATKPGGWELLIEKHTSQAFFIFLSGRQTRKATFSFLRALDPQKAWDTVLIGERSHEISGFWYYLPAIYEKLIALNYTPEQAGEMLCLWAYRFYDVAEMINYDFIGDFVWDDWLGEKQRRLAEHLDQDIIKKLIEALISLSGSPTATHNKISPPTEIQPTSRWTLPAA